MIDFQAIAAVIFVVLLSALLYAKRKNLETKQIMPYFLYFSMYRTKLGLRLMDLWAKKYTKFVRFLGYLGILVGFLGMILISYSLVSNIYHLFTKPEAVPGVGLVLPFKAKGVFFVPFFYWIISIFVIAVVHEFMHGLIARANNLKVKSSGFAFVGTGIRGGGILISVISLYFIFRNKLEFSGFLDFSSPYPWLFIGIIMLVLSYTKITSQIGIPVIPAAFVEPDEKELRKRSHKEQLSVFAAGPFANILFAFLFLAIASFTIAPLVNAVIEANGVKITDFVEGENKFPAEATGISVGEVIQEVDGKKITYVENLSAALKTKKPGDSVQIRTEKNLYSIKLAKNPENESLAYIGTYLEQNTRVKENVKASIGEFLPNAAVWVYGLLVILVILNLGI